jgi:hypothetical protein
MASIFPVNPAPTPIAVMRACDTKSLFRRRLAMSTKRLSSSMV